MSKNIKEVIGILIFSIINISISFAITSMLNISNIVLFKTLNAISWDVTYELIIFMCLSIIESIIYDFSLTSIKNPKRA